MLLSSVLLAMIGLGPQQAKVGGSAVLGGNLELTSPNPTGGSQGPAGDINVSDGAGNFLATGCNFQNGIATCNTFATTRSVTHGGKTCHLFPDTNYWNADVSGYPLDPFSSQYIGAYTYPSADFSQNPNPTISAATWAGGTVTATVSNTAHITSGNAYFINGATSTGYNTNCTSLGVGCYATVTVVDGTHVTYPITSNPGAFSGTGVINIGWFRFGPVPSMYLNFADNSTAVPSYTWQAPGTQSDGGFYPLLPTFQVEGYNFGGTNNVSAGPYAGDAHVLTINMDTCQLYETFALQNASPPYLNANGAIWDLNSNDLRTAKKLLWYGNDSLGVTSADAAGLPIWPGVLQFNELRPDLSSSAPIAHAVRVSLTKGGFGFVWPASHNACSSTCLTDGPPYGAHWRLSASFDTTTCHFQDCAGLPWPPYMVRFLTAAKKYGVIFADGGLNVGVITDADQSWGDPNSPSSYQYMFASYLHGIQWKDGEIVEPTIHVVNVLSGATK